MADNDARYFVELAPSSSRLSCWVDKKVSQGDTVCLSHLREVRRD